ncbi:MAG TPA: type IV pilus assembly protein PilM, partial [Acidimicrobiales bacterium]|nr:type IV pilus assembly protein PilM [Acidimicrobiales bacterium]
ELSAALRRLWQNGRFATNEVVVGIAGLRAITRELDIPWVADDEVDSAVRFQSEEVIPFSPEKTLLSTQVMADSTAPDGTRTRRILVAAAHHDLVNGVVQAVNQAGLEVRGVDLVSSALVRALVDPAKLSAHPEAIVSVGAGLTVIVVHQGGRPLFVRTLGVGGHAATEAISGSLDIPIPDAEQLKRQMDGSSPQLKSAQRATGPVIDDLVGDIRNSIQYFCSMPGRQPLSRVLVTGGGSQLHGLIEELHGQLHIPVLLVSPFERVDISDLEMSAAQLTALGPVVATAVGLALPEPNPAVRRFNLVPPEVLRRVFERKVARYTITAAAVVAGALLLFGGWRLWNVHSVEHQVNTLNSSLAQLKAEIPTFNKASEAVTELHTAQGEVTTLTAKAVDWSAVLNQLNAVTPSGLAVDSLQATGGPTGTGASTGTGSSGGGATPGATTSGGIGSMTVSVSGSFPNTAHFSPVAEWIDAISGTSMFAPPSVTGVTNAPNGGSTTVTFSSVVSIMTGGSLSTNGSM